MGIVKGSVTVATPNAGNYQVTMPESDLDIVGFAPIGYTNGPQYAAPQIVGIFIDASNIAYFPLPIQGGYTIRKYSPIHVKLKGNILNLNIPYTPVLPSDAGLTIFYGTPDGSEIEYETLKGVPFAYTNSSTTASVSGTLSITFPSGKVRIVGILVQGLNGGYGQISFVTGTGNILFIPFINSPDPMDLPDNITALDLESATVLSLNYYLSFNSNGNATVTGIIYYD